MNARIKYYVLGLIVILLSTPLGYLFTGWVGSIQGNLTGEYVPLLNGFIHSLMLIGVLLFSIGLANTLGNKNR